VTSRRWSRRCPPRWSSTPPASACAIAESSTSEEILSRVRGAGGRVVADLADYAETDKLSGMSYNHPVYFLQQAHPERSWFHMETGGTVHWDDPNAVRAIYDGPVSLPGPDRQS
jgi:hypothetical protein